MLSDFRDSFKNEGYKEVLIYQEEFSKICEMNQGNKIGVDAVVKKEIDEIKMNQEIEGQKKNDTNQELITPKHENDENHSNSDSNLSETNKITKSDPIIKTLS